MNALEAWLNEELSAQVSPTPVYTGTSPVIDVSTGGYVEAALPIVIIENVTYPPGEKVFGQIAEKISRMRYQLRCIALERDVAGELAETVTAYMNALHPSLILLNNGWVCISIEYVTSIPKVTQVDRDSGYAYTQAGPEYVFSLQKG